MFGIDTLDLLNPPKPKPKLKLRRVSTMAMGVAAIVIILLYPWVSLPSFGHVEDYSGVLLILGAIAINVLVSIGLGYLAYHAARNRMDRW